MPNLSSNVNALHCDPLLVNTELLEFIKSNLIFVHTSTSTTCLPKLWTVFVSIHAIWLLFCVKSLNPVLFYLKQIDK